MTGDDHRPAFFAELGNGEIEDVVQCIQDTLNRATSGNVNDGIGVLPEDVAGNDYVGPAEKHDGVSIGRCVRSVKQHNTFAVNEVAKLHLLEAVGIGGQHAWWRGLFAGLRVAQSGK